MVVKIKIIIKKKNLLLLLRLLTTADQSDSTIYPVTSGPVLRSVVASQTYCVF